MAKKTFQASNLMLRAAAASTVDAENRTVEVIMSTGATVKRYDWIEGEYYESVDVDGIDLSRAEGAPVLISHNRSGEIVGVVERAWVADGKLYGLLRFSKNATAEPIWQDVVDGIRRQVSLGAEIDDLEIVEMDGRKEIIVRKCTFLEVSIVNLGADAGAVFRSADEAKTITVTMPDDMADEVAVERSAEDTTDEAAPEADSAEGAPEGAAIERSAETEASAEQGDEPDAAPSESAEAPASVEHAAEDFAEVAGRIVEMAMSEGCPDLAASLIRSKASLSEAEGRIKEFGGIKRSVAAAQRAYPSIITQAVADEALKAGGIQRCRELLFERLVAADAATEVSNSIQPRHDEAVERSEKGFDPESVWAKRRAARNQR